MIDKDAFQGEPPGDGNIRRRGANAPYRYKVRHDISSPKAPTIVPAAFLLTGASILKERNRNANTIK
jgi:hypothetical protein